VHLIDTEWKQVLHGGGLCPQKERCHDDAQGLDGGIDGRVAVNSYRCGNGWRRRRSRAGCIACRLSQGCRPRCGWSAGYDVDQHVDPLGDHQIALYTIDGRHKDVWLVTTDPGCEQPRLEGDGIVATNAQGQVSACHSLRIQSVDQRQLASQLLLLQSAEASGYLVDLGYTLRQEQLAPSRWADRMTDGGRTR